MSGSLRGVTAVAHPEGNRVDLAWDHLAPPPVPGVLVVRRRDSHPQTPDDGVVVAEVAEGSEVRSVVDSGLPGETVHYYTLFCFRGSPPAVEEESNARVAALATAPHDFAGLMYQLLPEVYRRFDAAPLALRRFLQLPGEQLDQIYSEVRAALDLCDLERVDGRLLPLLAEWIGWPTNYALTVSAQRTEVRQAPWLYRSLGNVATLEATVARVTGRSCRTKEFVHNVARTNQPERFTHWSAVRGADGTWGPAALVSENTSFGGRSAATSQADGSLLLAYHTLRRHGWDIWTKVLHEGGWQPSTSVVSRPGLDRNPSLARQGERLWLFWEASDSPPSAGSPHWRIGVRTRDSGTWSPVTELGEPGPQRRLPTACTDPAGGLWLFWWELTGSGWRLLYNRHDGTDWQRATPGAVPFTGGPPPDPDGDLAVGVHPSDPSHPLWLCWSRRTPTGTDPAAWTVSLQVKATLDPDAADWSSARTMPRPAGVLDREPVGLPSDDGGFELFWSSTRAGGWSIHSCPVALDTLTFGAAERVTTSPYSQRAPLAHRIAAGATLLTYRSNRDVPRIADTDGAPATLDLRYAGTTTVDTRSTEKLRMLGSFEDFQSYTYDAGTRGTRTAADRIARDTVGLFLGPATGPPEEAAAAASRLRSVLREFMPINARAVVVTP